MVQQEEPVGIITPHEVKTVDRARWPYTTVVDVMRPLESLRTVSAERPLAEALEIMGREDINQMPVVQQGKLAGIISRAPARAADPRGSSLSALIYGPVN